MLITDRTESNTLAYQLLGFSEEGIVVYPIYSYNKIDKDFVNYDELIYDDTLLASVKDKVALMSSNDSSKKRFMYVDVSFGVYAKSYVNKYNKIGSVRMRMTLNYFPSNDADYNSYVGRFEVCVTPTSKYTLRSFNMTPVFSNEIPVGIENSGTNNESAIETRSFTFNTGIAKQEGAEVDASSGDATISVGTSNNISMSFGYSISHPSGASSVVETANRLEFDNFYGYKIQVTRSGGTKGVINLSHDQGKTFMGLYYATLNIDKKLENGGVGFVFSDLSLWAQAGEPSYSEGNIEKVWVQAGWDQPFNNRVIMVAGSSRDGDQYFEDYRAECSLSNEGALGGVAIFKED
ncbi:MAG: hypothetical protein K2L70_02565 [Clostridia bacterium]|nr:hypothetical protein [Clostridia bacterium]